ncbi:hypothetical protein AALP_AA8G278800 [Arabis alpina]|uniref:DUF7950 domain-containing protein n=1 Tax=Arabis alpina TaxID=50452 RepID=A0A087G9X7_ARAAL|nr:hypothetical protein AALP_AA8G278800 [Arabis alpina]
MNFRGSCCTKRYGGGNDMSNVDRIMLRYRPIAPRPDSGGSSSPPVNSVSSKSQSGKRKHSKDKSSSSGSVNSNGSSKRRNRRRNEDPKSGSGVGERVTLSLLPERKENLSPESSWLSFGDNGRQKTATDLITVSVATSLLTVECVTEGWVDVEYELGCTDEEKKMNLERDTCPGFISDGLGRVVWTNASYREMVSGGEEKASKMSVWLVMKERPLLTHRTFTCRMRLQYTCRSITSPCDVWKMNDGGFAWRLDVNAALCLGR